MNPMWGNIDLLSNTIGFGSYTSLGLLLFRLAGFLSVLFAIQLSFFTMPQRVRETVARIMSARCHIH